MYTPGGSVVSLTDRLRLRRVGSSRDEIAPAPELQSFSGERR
jgi:hypothetical protein